MTLHGATEGKQYIIAHVMCDDAETAAFLCSLGCYSGGTVTVLHQKRSGCTVCIKGSRYHIDARLAESISVV